MWNRIWHNSYRYCVTRGHTLKINFFIFGPISKIFFSLDSLWKSLPAFFNQIWRTFYRFRDIKDQKGPKTHISKVPKIFIFYPIWTIFFAKCRSYWELSVMCQRIWAIFYRFRDIRGQRGPKMHISTVSEIFISYPIWMIFFLQNVGLIEGFQ